jgi:hypothetical protein
MTTTTRASTDAVRRPPPPRPLYRRLRGFAFDPSVAQRIDTRDIGTIVFRVPWEDLKPGPIGEYVEVVDFDPTSRCFYEPVNLEHPHLLAQDGLPPAEGTPQFHQQMAYAVARLTIDRFEKALGRKALWSPRGDVAEDDPSRYVQRLRIYPHALREANAYYSPSRKALLFGYFCASPEDPGDHLPGSFVFGCLSHDIIAHETAHALLDGMHRRFCEPSNPDMQAFHEAFADIVALLLHFTYPEIVRDQISRTRGGLRSQAHLLGVLATEFGRAMGTRGALRDYIGKRDEKTGAWKPHVPVPEDYDRAVEPHARGAILVAAVFDAFLGIYERRTHDLVRLATGGSGVLPAGAIHPDLVNRLAGEASKTAEHVLRMCIRALDYCPPIDLTFGEYLRAVITADRDIVPDDDLGYRVAFTEAFRRRAIYPRDVRTLTEDALIWRGTRSDPDRQPSEQLLEVLVSLRQDAPSHLDEPSRELIFERIEALRKRLRGSLEPVLRAHPEDAKLLGLELKGPEDAFEVHSVRFADRVGPDGQLEPECMVELIQRRDMSAKRPARGKTIFQGGATIVISLRKDAGRETADDLVKYVIRKSITSKARLERQITFHESRATGALWNTYFGERMADAGAEPFAFAHRS